MKINGRGQAAVINNDEFSKIRRQVRSTKYKLMLDILWFTGERCGAVVQLQVSDVYDENGMVRDEITFRANTRKKRPDGTVETRQVPIHDVLREGLQNYKPSSHSIWLFPNRDGEKHITLRNAADILMRAVDRAGLTSKGISTHSFRRTFITRLHSNGTSPVTIKKITGHKDMKALERYIDVTDDQIKGAIANL
ncbi:MAG TPA: tyrosine-type recombinase/integrase [Nostocaceae cyanobacterium]|nr:tyrosine-type recombinase/integrase [Nostocaceae cyanobacterium]